MEALFASKLYRASDRKDKIRAAVANPVNLELVSQVAKYLDPEYQQIKKEKALLRQRAEDLADFADQESPDGVPSDLPGSFSDIPSGPSSVPSGPSGDFAGETYEDADMGSEDDPASDADVSDSADEPDVDASEDVEAVSPILGSETEPVDTISKDDISSVPNTLKGTLNAREVTAGVNRVQVKQSELWVYYNDAINLNNVMTEVIDLIQASGYHFLNFNRLARSDNAMVFDISIFDTGESIEVTE